MAYTKQTWNNGDVATPLSGARLGHIEDGVEAADATATATAGRATALEVGRVTASPHNAVADGSTDASAAFASALTAVGAGGRALVPRNASSYRVGDVALSAEGQTLSGDGFGLASGVLAGTMLRAKTGAAYVLKSEGVRWSCLRNMALDGTTTAARLAKGLLIASTSGGTSQSVELERLLLYRCSVGLEILGPGLTQADNNTLVQVQFIENTRDMYIGSSNAQETVLIGCKFGSLQGSEHILMASGCLTMLGGQFQGTFATSVGILFQGTDDGGLGWVNLKDVIFEGPTTDIDGTTRWPDDGVIAENTVFQGPTANVVMGVANSAFTARSCRFNRGGVGTSLGKIKLDGTGCSVVLDNCDNAPTIECNATGCSVFLINQRVAPTFTGSQTPQVLWIDNGRISFGTAKDTYMYRNSAALLQISPTFLMGDMTAIIGGGEGLYINGITVYRHASAVPSINITAPVTVKSYTTAGRPAATDVLAGTQIYDTTLGKPTWSNGTVWKDAAGTTV